MGALRIGLAGLLLGCGLSVKAQAPSKPLVLVLIGPAGSGKTTQATYLTKKLKIPVVAADQLRKPGGNLDEALRQRIAQPDAAAGFILDGYPSTRAQADFLNTLVKERGLAKPLIIQIDVKDQVIRERLKTSSNPDDKGPRLEQRLAEYHRELDLVRSYYPDSDIWTINGERSPADVSATILSLLEDRK